MKRLDKQLLVKKEKFPLPLIIESVETPKMFWLRVGLKETFWTFIVKLQPDLEYNLNELEQTWTSRVRSWLYFPMSQQQEREEQHLILLYRIGI